MNGRALQVLLVLVLVLGAGSAHGHSSDLAPGEAGVPAQGELAAEQSCAACHTGTSVDTLAGGIELTGLPERYVPGRRYALGFEIHHPEGDRLRWGFVVTAVASQTLRGAGRLRVTDPRNTRKLRGIGGREYLAHTYAGTAIGKTRGQRWSFEWVAPGVEMGEVAFFAAGVAADGDGSEKGDLVYEAAPLALVPGPAPEPEPPTPVTPLEIE